MAIKEIKKCHVVAGLYIVYCDRYTILEMVLHISIMSFLHYLKLSGINILFLPMFMLQKLGIITLPSMTISFSIV